MTMISSSFLSFQATAINALSASKYTKSPMDGLLPGESASKTDLFGAAFSLDISTTTITDECGCDSLGNALTYSPAQQKKAKDKVEDTFDALFACLTQMVSEANRNHDSASVNSSDSDDELKADGFTPHAGYSASFVGDPNSIEDIIANSGPLPQFLAQVEAQHNMNTDQIHSLENIAWEFRNANDTPETVRQIDDALDAAGIGHMALV